jgi:branched-subunit amino acid ABC-type transport system permease component
MNKRLSLNFGTIIALAAVGIMVYYLLLRDSNMPFSINAMVHTFDHWIRHWHVLVVGIVPIYIALMIFGAGIIGMYLGNVVQRWICHFLKLG